MSGVLITRQKEVQAVLTHRKWDRLLWWYSFFMAFPAIVIGQNISIYVFVLLWILLISKGIQPIDIRKSMQWVALFFGAGALLSVANIPVDAIPNGIGKSLEVLPNYLYWAILIIFLITHRHKININQVFNALFWGVIASILYYFIFQRIGLLAIPFFKKFSQNAFAFLIICYAPIATYYVRSKYGFKKAALMVVFLVLAGFLSGSRSGSLLVLSGSVAALYADRIRLTYVIPSALFLYFIAPVVGNLSAVKDIVFALNPRTYELLYESKKVLEEDRSYLIRVAMVQKGMNIYEKYPYTGIGVGNFTIFNTDFRDDFKGAKYVIHKGTLNQTSSHNSYIGILAEGGLFHFIPFMILLGNYFHGRPPLFYYGHRQRFCLVPDWTWMFARI
jgi:O-antigen ligase